MKQSRYFFDAIAAAFDGFDLIVETFDKAAGDRVHKIVEDRLPVGGQGLDKLIETINLAAWHFLHPTIKPSFPISQGLGLIKNGGQFFLKGIAEESEALVNVGNVSLSLLAARRHADPGATWQKHAGRPAVFGYKVHTLLCRQTDLPVFVLVTPAHIHDSLVGWLLVVVAALIFDLRVEVVYADAAYFDKRFFGWIYDWLGAHPAVDYNLAEPVNANWPRPFSSANGVTTFWVPVRTLNGTMPGPNGILV